MELQLNNFGICVLEFAFLKVLIWWEKNKKEEKEEEKEEGEEEGRERKRERETC